MKKKLSFVHPNAGFTLIEILVVIGIIAILAAIVLVAVNPGRQFAQARNSQRLSNTAAILNAIGQNLVDNIGTFTCAAGSIPSTPTEIKSTAGYDMRDCIVPNYLPEIPADPSAGKITSPSDYNTGYMIAQDATTKRITITAPNAELGQTISISR